MQFGSLRVASRFWQYVVVFDDPKLGAKKQGD